MQGLAFKYKFISFEFTLLKSKILILFSQNFIVSRIVNGCSELMRLEILIAEVYFSHEKRKVIMKAA